MYDENKSPPSLPMYVLFDFGETYTRHISPLIKLKKNWVLIKPTKTTLWTSTGTNIYIEYTNTQMSFKLLCGWAL